MATSYSDKLRDPRWQKKRLEVLQRDNFTCKYCEDKTTELHIHHLEYKGDPWDVDNDKLETTCKYCHAILEGLKEHFTKFGNIVLRIRNAKYTNGVYHSIALLKGVDGIKYTVVCEHTEIGAVPGLFVSLDNLKEVIEKFDKV